MTQYDMRNKLILNQKVNLDEKIYKVIGIDYYVLKNVLNLTRKWTSYTLIDKDNHKTWISYGVAGRYFTQWATIAKLKFKNEATMPAYLELSGIANVSFQGNRGYSTPFTEIVWFKTANINYDFLAIERFLKQTKSGIIPLESYFLSGKILKNFRP